MEKAWSKAGFSLAEVVMAVSISAFVLTSAYAAIISLAKGTESLVNYAEMNGNSRTTLEIFGRDARATRDVYNYDTNRFTLLRKTWNGSDYVDRFVTYFYVPEAGTFSRVERRSSIVKGERVPGDEVKREILLYDVEDLKLSYFRLHDPEIVEFDPVARTIPEVKHVQLEAKLVRNVLNAKNTNYIISARFMMRNKYVSE